MSPLLGRGREQVDISDRLAALRAVLHLGAGRLEPTLLDPIGALVERAGQRLALSGEHTVVALAGATGSGKSSLFNALAGQQLADVGVRRPTTALSSACVWSTGRAADRLLDWLKVSRRHVAPDPAGSPDLGGLVLLDLPDNDSVQAGHRIEVDRLVEQADVLVWVTDPEKYADAVLHERYLRRLAGHAAVTVVVLNQADRLSPSPAACLTDLRRLLADDGLGSVPVLAVSARTGEGLDQLREVLAVAVRRREARAQRVSADIDDAAARLAAALGEGAVGELPRPVRDELVAALEQAAGVSAVVDTVRATYRARAIRATGWPLTRWAARLRRDPLRRLELAGASSSAARISLPPPSPAARAQVATAIGRAASAVAGNLPVAWQDSLVQAAAGVDAELTAALDQAVARGASVTSAGMRHRPGWWRLLGWLQWLLVLALVVAVAWLVALAVVAWLQLPELPSVQIGTLPLPTVLLLGAGGGGVLLAGLGRVLARLGARQRARRVRAHLREQIEQVADEHVLDPLRGEAEAYARLQTAVRQAAGIADR